jgi:hypothetical protein
MSTPEEQVQPPPQAQTTRAPKRWPLVNSLQARAAITPSQTAPPLTKDARLVNAFAEYDAEDQAYWVYKRPGLGPTPFASGTASAGLGSYCFNDLFTPGVLSVWGGSLYYTSIVSVPVPHFSTILIGAVDGTAPYFFETINSNPRTVVLGNGVKGYVFTPSTVALAQITDVNFPTAFVPGWVYLDGFLYIMDTAGKIWGTAGQNNAVTWSGTNVISASSNSDAGVGLVKQLTYVIAIKQWTAQVFYDAGNPTGSPLGPVPDSQLPYGGFIGSSVQIIDNTVLWITSNQTVSPQVVQMDNLTPKIVSSPAVERLLDNATFTGASVNPSVNGGVITWVLKHGGHRFYGISLLALNLTLVYDIDQKLWYQWTDVNGNFWPMSSMTYFPPSALSGSNFQPGIHLAQHYSNGNLYQLDGDYEFPTDYGNVFPVDIYTPNLDFGVARRKMLKTLYFYGDRLSKIKVRFSDDDFTTWSNFREVDLSRKKPRLTNCGTFEERRAYHIRHQAATTFRLRDMDMQMDIGTL